jgi:hypothetical protein
LPCASNSAVSIADLAKVLPLMALLIRCVSAFRLSAAAL